MHLNTLYNLDKHIYTDALLQPIHNKDEYRAFATLVDRHQTAPGKKTIFIGDSGYCSYNNMAHVIEKGQFFLLRAKDIHSKGLLSGFDFPDGESLSGSGFANMIDKYCEKAGVEKIPLRAFHSLRRSFETVMVSHGLPIETVSQMVGHKTIKEDKPYITHNKEKASFVAMNFTEVPITDGLYAGHIGRRCPQVTFEEGLRDSFEQMMAYRLCCRVCYCYIPFFRTTAY